MQKIVTFPRTDDETPLTFCWFEIPPAGEGESAVVAEHRTCLNDEEKESADRFRFRADYYAYVTAHALLRRCLTHYVGLPPDAWVFAKSSLGRPSVANRLAQPIPGISLSHTRELVACAVTFEDSCGVDVERIGRIADPLRLAESNFAATEIEALRCARGRDRDELFTALWCLKEAYLKATGTGLSVPLDGFGFQIEHLLGDRIAFQGSHEEGHLNWRFRLLRPSPTHFAAIAVRSDPHS